MLPERLEYIGKFCFYGIALTSISLPPLLRIIEKSAFRECKHLKTVEFPDGLEKIGLFAFEESGVE